MSDETKKRLEDLAWFAAKFAIAAVMAALTAFFASKGIKFDPPTIPVEHRFYQAGK